MRRLLTIPLLAGALAAIAPPAAMAGSLSQGERDRAMSYLHATRKQFLDIVTSATDEQWRFKPAPERWSIAEIAEHIALSEDLIFKLTTKVADGPAASAKSEVKDEAIAQKLTDRSQKAQAPEPLKPSLRWKTREALIAEFKQWRDRTIEYAETTPVDLRARLSKHPLFGAIDAYQWLLLIAGHSERHILQMREVMEAPGYPAGQAKAAHR